ncbi:MAG TPA: DUF6636 domain-containing protein [Gaiellaceae bacterium]|jgi:hypothetical protein
MVVRYALLLALALPATAAAVTRLPALRTPSGNISCFAEPKPAILFCRIRRADYARRLEAHCAAPPIEVDWAGFELGATRKGSISCSGGVLYDPATQRPAYVTLRYGSTRRSGPFTCSSRVTGLTCRSRAGHGLFISRQSWRAW